ncbi:MAG: sulfite exporter TauE/SafE family protein [Bacteroidales bacterium]|jgi:ABC-type nickel/cobalt efflux system permease component RcnA|nr:sulfite exporter TauE/SafE family protein [Bacteroidales bacterium]
MENSIAILSVTAVSLAFFHTLLGPDHYLPFIVLSEARKWTVRRTMLITFLCGVGHVLGSVILGMVGIAAGISVAKLVDAESVRGSIAAWLFIAFGLVYMMISVRNLIKNRRHTHSHNHSGCEEHRHEHSHSGAHTHVHETGAVKTTPWILFLIFVFGPCEPLIPILMYPAARSNVAGAVFVSAVFAAVTIATMMLTVLAFKLGLNRINLKPVEKYSHLIAGATIFLSGMAIQFLGL